MPFPPRDSQTRIKHEILRAYIGAWAGIIGAGVRRPMLRSRQRGQQFRLELVYVDGFAGFGRYERDSDAPRGKPVWGSPIIAIRALEEATVILRGRGIDTRITAVLVDMGKDGQVDELFENLGRAALKTAVQSTPTFEASGKGRVNVIRGDFRDHVDSIICALGDKDFVLSFIDPWGPTMALESLRPLLGRARTDAITLFLVLDVERWGAAANKPVDELTPTDRTNLSRTTEQFGTAEWMSIARRGDLSRVERENLYAKLYQRQLQLIALDLVVKEISLRFSGLDRTAYSLFLTTRDASGALRMNDILRQARFREHWTLWSDREERLRERSESTGILELPLGIPRADPPHVEMVIPPVEEVTEAVLKAISPETSIRYKTLLGRLANHPYRKNEIDKALRRLRRDGVVDFDQLTKNALIWRAEES